MRNKGSALLKGITKFALAVALFMGTALFTGLVPVAMAADSRVSTLGALRNAVNAGGKIVIEADISLDSDASDTDKSDNYLTIKSNTVLDLNGHRIYRELSSDVTNGYIIYVPANGSLTILDSAGGGGLTGGNSTYESIRPSAVYVRGTLVLNGGSIYNNRNTARGGGAVVVEGGSFTMNGGEICGNEGKDGGVVVADGRFTMNGGSIHNNTGTSNAGGVYMTNNATNVFTMNGGYIRDNTCRDRGAGVYVQNGKFTLNGGQIRGNRINSINSSAIGCGGGVYVEYGSFTMTGGSITGNGAYPGSASARGGSGGGVYLWDNSSGATISGGRITGNTTGVGNGSSLESGNGAGIYVGGGSRLTVSGAPVIAGNTQDGRPNDLYLKSGKLAIGEGGLQAGASIGIMHYEHNKKWNSQHSPTTFTEGLVGNTGVFFANAFYYNSRMYEYAIQRDGDEAQLTYVGDSDLTVTFMRGDGTDAVHATQRVIPGGSASRPAEPVRDGHVFEGWHTDAETATPYAFGGKLTDNLTLYAHWVESATVTFHTNGGMGGMEPQVFGKGLEQNLNPSLFFRDYCIFDGWTANADGTGAKYADRAAITVTGDTNLYALWTPINYNITIAGPSNGTVTAKVGEKDNATTANYNDTVTLTVTPDPGYMLDTLTVKQGEADVTVTDNRFTMPAGDVTVSATFKLIPATAPAIDTQPSDLSLTYGYTTGSVLSVAASAAERHTLSYQWYSNANATSEGGTEISGATEASYAVPTGKIAGTTEYYYCVVTATHTDNSQTAETTSNTATVSIGKAPLTITANSKSIYVGDAIPALDDYKVEWLLNQDALTTAPTLVYQKNGEAVTPDNTTAGIYYIVPSGANAGNNYSISYTNGTLTISEKPPATVTKAPTARSLTYNGQEQELVTAGTASGGTMQYAIGTDEATAPTDETLYTTSIPAAAEAGIYYVWYKVDGDANHNDYGPYPVTVSILKEKVTPEKPTGESLVYSGKEQPLVKAGSVEGDVGTLLYAVGTDGKTAPTKADFKASVPTGKDAGTYHVWYMVRGDKNHNDTDPAALEAKIARKSLVVTPADKSKTYGEVDPELTWSQEGLVDGDALNVTLKRAEGENVGGYAIAVDKVEVSENYEVSTNEAVFTIEARSVTVTAADQTIDEGGAIKTGVKQAKLSGQGEGHALSAVTLTASGAKITASSAKIADANGVDVTGNYSITYVSGKLTVNPKPTAKPTVKPTKTPRPTAKPTVKPTKTPRPTAKPTVKPTRTPRPTAKPTVKPTRTPRPTAKPTVKPTRTPRPTETPKPAADPDFTLLARMTVSGESKTALKIAWTEVKGAEGYDVFFAKCGRNFKLKKTVRSWESHVVRFRGLDKRENYKGYVKAWKKVDGQKVYIGKASPQVHAITGGYDADYCNTRSVKLNHSSLTLKAGKSKRLKATMKGVKSGKKVLQHIPKVRFYSTNANVATVDANGKVKAVAKGSCTIYAIANNGVRNSVKVTVK